MSNVECRKSNVERISKECRMPKAKCRKNAEASFALPPGSQAGAWEPGEGRWFNAVREIDLSPRCELQQGPAAATIDRDDFRSVLFREHPQ